MSEYEQEQEQGAVEPEAQPEPEPAPEPQFDPQEAYGHLVGQMDEIRNAVSQLYEPPVQQYEQEPQYAEEDFDPFDQDSVANVVNQALQQQMAPLVQALQPIVDQHNDAQSIQYVEGVFGRLGVPDDLRDEVLIMSGGYRLAGQSPEQAISSAYQSIQGLRGGGVEQGRLDQRNELQQIVSAPGVPNGSQPGAVPGESRPQNMEEAAQRIAARLGIG